MFQNSVYKLRTRITKVVNSDFASTYRFTCKPISVKEVTHSKKSLCNSCVQGYNGHVVNRLLSRFLSNTDHGKLWT